MFGGDIDKVSPSSVKACKELCEKTTDCTAFVYYAGDKDECVTKNKWHGDETENAIATTARMSCFEGDNI